MTVKTNVRARDLMVTDLVTIAPDASLKEAVATLEEYRIGGAPVIDSAGALVGVLSMHDLASTDRVREGRLDAERAEYYLRGSADDRDAESDEPWFFGNEDYSSEVLARETVADWMSRHVISVEPDTELKALCDLMVTESIHRVLVLEQGRLKGIISALDIVRFLANSL